MTQTPFSQEILQEQLETLLLNIEKLAQSYFMLGHLEKALQIFQMGGQVFHLPEVTQRDQARFLLHYGNMLAARTQFQNAPVEEALAMLEQAKQLATLVDDEQIIAGALDGLGFASYVAASNKRQGDPIAFRRYFQEALERRRTLKDELGVSQSLFHLGLTADVLGQRTEAHQYYIQALEIARLHSYAAETSEALRHLGFHEQEKKNFSQALQYFTESLLLRKQMGMSTYLPFSHVVIADIYLAQENLELADAQCQQALELARKMDITRALIFSLFFSGRVCQKKQQEMQARDYFEQAHQVAQSIGLDYAAQEAATALQGLSHSPQV